MWRADWLLALLLTAPGREATGQTALFVTFPGAERPSLTMALVRELAGRGIAVLPIAQPIAASRASVLLAAAGQAYGAMRHEEALSLLEDVRREADRTGAEGSSRLELVSAELLWALAERALGRMQLADEALIRALAIDPGISPDPVEYPPWLRERLEALQAELQPAARLVLTGPEGAEVWLDGELACRLPCTIDVGRGIHRVRSVLRGWLSAIESVAVREAVSIEIRHERDAEASCERVRAARARGQSIVQAARLALDVADIVLTLEALPSGELLAVSISATGEVMEARVRPGADADDPRLARSIAAALSRPAPASPAPQRTHRAVRHSSWALRAWPWLAAGAAVAIGAAISLTISTSSEERFVPVVRLPQR